MSSDRLARATAAAVLLVASIAAVVSFVHIQRLAVTHGQTPLAAYLLPVSVDGTVAAASLVMLRAARAGLGTPVLARTMLGLAVAATLAANVAYGVPYGAPGALLSGWPAVAFIGCAEMAIGMVRRTSKSGSRVPDLGPEISRAAGDLPVPAAVPLPGVREIRATYQCSQGTAQKIRKAMRTVTSSPAGASVAPAPGPPAGVTLNGHKQAERR